MTAPQTISPLIPVLRFPQFANADAWQSVRLGEVCESVASGRNKTKLLEGAFPVFGSTGIIGYTNDPVYDYCSIIVARVGANAGMINIATGRYDVSDNAIIIQLKDVNLFFVYYYLTITNLNKIAFGSGQPLITATQLKRLPLPLPTLPEQQKIASCLSSLDEYISLTKKKLDLLKLHKKGLLQNLFPKNGETKPKFRFPGFEDEWKVVKLGEVCEILQNNTFSRAELNNENGNYLNIHYGDVLIKYGSILNVSKDIIPYITDDTRCLKYSKSLLRDGDVVFADTAEDETVGKCTEIVDVGKNNVISGLHTIPVRFNIKFAKGFLGIYLNSNSYHNQFLKIMQGTKVSSISKTQIKETWLLFPSLAEQERIASCLSSIDYEIASYDEKIKAMEVHKKGLMQKLFPKIN